MDDIGRRLEDGFRLLAGDLTEDLEELEAEAELEDVYSIAELWESLAGPIARRPPDNRIPRYLKLSERPIASENLSYLRRVPPPPPPPREIVELRRKLKSLERLVRDLRQWRELKLGELDQATAQVIRRNLFPELRELRLARRWILQIDGELRLLLRRQGTLLRRLEGIHRGLDLRPTAVFRVTRAGSS
jgi:hypothetical protein